jgi:hypothetical protein
MAERKACPECGADCERMEVDVGVGNVYGPWACFDCGWEDRPPLYADLLLPIGDDEPPF